MKNRGNMIFAMSMVVIVLIAIAAMVYFKNQSNDSAVDTKKNPTAANIDVKDQPMLGKKDAPVTIVEFGDYKCPACKYFDMEMQPELQKKYIDKGDVKMYFINTPFHGEESTKGALAAEAVLKQEPEKYWAFHNALFALQPNNHSTDEVWLNDAAVKKALAEAKVKDSAAIMKSVKDAKEKEAVDKDIALYQKHKITMTPTLFVNGQYIADPMQMDQIVKAIEDAKKNAKK